MFFNVLVVLIVYWLSDCGSVLIRAPSIFRSDEPNMHKYSVVLAATEPFRIQCEDQIRRSLNPVSYAFHRLMGKSSLEVGERERDKNVAVDVALTRFEVRLQNALRSYGMEVQDFNALSDIVSKEKMLKKKVLLQSYLYKLAADLETNLQNKIPSLSSSKQHQLQQQQQQQQQDGNNLPPRTRTSSSWFGQKQKNTHVSPLLDADDEIPEVTRFAQALRKIEIERIRIRDQIKRDLHLRELPPRMADPEYLPAMCPTIQKACKEFPQLANQIIRKNGLHVEEFNLLQTKLAKNVWFRYKVERELEKIKQEV